VPARALDIRRPAPFCRGSAVICSLERRSVRFDSAALAAATDRGRWWRKCSRRPFCWPAAKLPQMGSPLWSSVIGLSHTISCFQPRLFAGALFSRKDVRRAGLGERAMLTVRFPRGLHLFKVFVRLLERGSGMPAHLSISQRLAPPLAGLFVRSELAFWQLSRRSLDLSNAPPVGSAFWGVAFRKRSGAPTLDRFLF
jgi:hypothetical protein